MKEYRDLTEKDINQLQHGDVFSLKRDPEISVTWLGWNDRQAGGACLGLIEGKQYFLNITDLVKFSLEIETMHEVYNYDE